MKKVFLAFMFLVGVSSFAFAGPGVTVIEGNVIVENVWFQLFGLTNLTIPWEKASVVYLVNFLCAPVQTIAGAEGPIFKNAIGGKLLTGNILIAAIISGGSNKGILGGSLDLQTVIPGVSTDFRLGPWIGSAFDGNGVMGGIKTSTKF